LRDIDAGLLVVPNTWQTFDRKTLTQLETYLGHIEIVRDGVLEVVLFPAPQSARLAVDDIHVKDALRQLKQARGPGWSGGVLLPEQVWFYWTMCVWMGGGWHLPSQHPTHTGPFAFTSAFTALYFGV
jgi:hypothetical protein